MVWTTLSTVILFPSIILYFDIICKGSNFSLNATIVQTLLMNEPFSIRFLSMI